MDIFKDQYRNYLDLCRKTFCIFLLGVAYFVFLSDKPLANSLHSRWLPFSGSGSVRMPQSESVYSLEEQDEIFSVLNNSLLFGYSQAFNFVNERTRLHWSNNDISWKGLKIPPKAFDFLITPACDVISQRTTTLIYVYSKATSFSQRENIRNTWASPTFTTSYNLTVIFVVSLPDSLSRQQDVHVEHRMFGDVLQVPVPETYDNLPFKSVASLAWISRCGRNVPTIAKVDDDSIPNIIYLQKMYKEKRKMTNNKVENLLYCKKLSGIPVKRTYNFLGKYKNIVSPAEFSNDFYPPYCQGRVLFMTTDVALSLFYVALRTEIFRVDDAYISGLLRSKSCINITDHYTYKDSFLKPLQWRGLYVDFTPFTAHLYTKLGLDITIKTSHVDMPEDLINEL